MAAGLIGSYHPNQELHNTIYVWYYFYMWLGLNPHPETYHPMKGTPTMLLFGIIYLCLVAAIYIAAVIELICNMQDSKSFKFSHVTPIHTGSVASIGGLLSICYYLAAWRAPEQGFTLTGASIFSIATLIITLFTAFGFPPVFSALWKVLSIPVMKMQGRKRRFEQWVDTYNTPSEKR